jgi:hypothetical protein
MTDTTNYETQAKAFTDYIIKETLEAQALATILANGDGTLYEWRENNPEEAAEAERLAEAIGFYIPNTDDFVWQAAELLQTQLAETGGYGYDAYKVIRITLAGGGPAGWIEFRLDSDGGLDRAEIGFVDWFKEPVVTTLSEDVALAAWDRYNVELIEI